jgi:hypothetical protein
MMEYMEQQMLSQIEVAENNREEMLNEIVRLEQNLEAMKAERDALAAQVEALSKLHSDLTNADMVFEDDVHSGYLITTEQIDEMEHLLATPAACLAQVRAEAVRAATAYGRAQTKYFLRSSEDILSEIEQYAESIRQEVK